jgi:nucleotide-binding universal stress UspA family protein
MEDEMLKDMVVNLSIDANDDATRDYAISLARLFGAHLAGVAFAVEPVPPAILAEGGPPEWFDELMREAEASADAAVARFNEAIRGSGILAEARRLTTSALDCGNLFSSIARRFDVSIIRQNEPDKNSPNSLMIEAALFDSGRPVLVVPYVQRGPAKLDRGLVCWDGSRNSARAVGDAMPLLERAKAVEIVIVGDRSKSREIPGADIAKHLARHGVNVEVKEIVAPDLDAANVILSHAADVSADFMVMGGYGHSRLREFILGGVTRSILNTMTLPTLMSH